MVWLRVCPFLRSHPSVPFVARVTSNWMGAFFRSTHVSIEGRSAWQFIAIRLCTKLSMQIIQCSEQTSNIVKLYWEALAVFIGRSVDYRDEDIPLLPYWAIGKVALTGFHLAHMEDKCRCLSTACHCHWRWKHVHIVTALESNMEATLLCILYDVTKYSAMVFYTLPQIIASESLRESIFITSIIFVAVEWIIIITDDNVIERERKCVIVFHLNVRLAVSKSRKFQHRWNDKMMKRKEHSRCRVCLWFVPYIFPSSQVYRS